MVVTLFSHLLVHGDETDTHDANDEIVEILNDMVCLHLEFESTRQLKVSLHLDQTEFLIKREFFSTRKDFFFDLLLSTTLF